MPNKNGKRGSYASTEHTSEPVGLKKMQMKTPLATFDHQGDFPLSLKAADHHNKEYRHGKRRGHQPDRCNA